MATQDLPSHIARIARIGGLLNEMLQARRVYSDRVERDGVIVVPAAEIGGGGGAEHLPGKRDAGGMGLRARPVGAFEIRNGDIKWQSALDWSRIILRAEVICVAAVVAAAWVWGRRRM